MKAGQKLFLILTLVIFATNVYGQKSEQSKKAGSAIRVISNYEDSLQYALGSYFGQWLLGNGFSVTDMELIKQGISDKVQKKPGLISDSIISEIINSYQLKQMVEKNRNLEETLFKALKEQPGIGIIPDGVYYMILKKGNGPRPELKDSIEFNALGVFPDGTAFEDTYAKKQTIKNSVGKLIPGLSEAVQLMPEGSVWRIFVPASLAYGNKGLEGLIPPDMALVFDISLVDVIGK
ncbi:MAG: FKBP-type peptidyl-prolyl cis-trans isomerase [Bacteroidales bacterium]|nr:FKBP-type peptidyl-prolyl cis-trans isomerase [Bacteroidales bacterium]MCB8998731.1 FKBP-type peptidyl-prolyl cis-trans isomerase [Bacteroidales bacterium]